MDASGSDPTAATNTDLLLALRDRGNEQAWVGFCARYRPVIVAFACRLGLPDQDAQDAAQEALLAFAEGYRQGRYDRSRGRLRTWLFGIAAHKIRDLQRHTLKRPWPDGEQAGAPLSELADDFRMSDLWETEWQRAVLDASLAEAAQHLEPATIAAFRLCVLEERDVDEVADELKMTRNAVLKAQRRVLTRLRQIHDRIMNDE